MFVNLQKRVQAAQVAETLPKSDLSHSSWHSSISFVVGFAVSMVLVGEIHSEKKYKNVFVNLQKQNYKNWFRPDEVPYGPGHHDLSKVHHRAHPLQSYDPLLSVFCYIFLHFSVFGDRFEEFFWRMTLWRLVRDFRDLVGKIVVTTDSCEKSSPGPSWTLQISFCKFYKNVFVNLQKHFVNLQKTL